MPIILKSVDNVPVKTNPQENIPAPRGGLKLKPENLPTPRSAASAPVVKENEYTGRSSRQFIDLLGAGESSDAKSALEELISSTAFEALNSRKQEIASTLFGGNQPEPEVQEESNEVTPEQGKKMMDSDNPNVYNKIKKIPTPIVTKKAVTDPEPVTTVKK